MSSRAPLACYPALSLKLPSLDTKTAAELIPPGPTKLCPEPVSSCVEPLLLVADPSDGPGGGPQVCSLQLKGPNVPLYPSRQPQL